MYVGLATWAKLLGHSVCIPFWPEKETRSDNSLHQVIQTYDRVGLREKVLSYSRSSIGKPQKKVPPLVAWPLRGVNAG